MKKKALLVDFFGTLVNYTPGSFFVNKRGNTYVLLQQHGFEGNYEIFKATFTTSYKTLLSQAKKTQVEFSMETLFRFMLADQPQINKTEAFISTLVQYYLAEWSQEIAETPGIQRFLSRASSVYTLGIVSNTHHSDLVRYNLSRFAMEKYFSIIVTSIAFGLRKPDPRIFVHALEKMNMTAQETIFIGDDKKEDFEGATKAGIDAYLVGKKPYETLFDLEGVLYGNRN